MQAYFSANPQESPIKPKSNGGNVVLPKITTSILQRNLQEIGKLLNAESLKPILDCTIRLKPIGGSPKKFPLRDIILNSYNQFSSEHQTQATCPIAIINHLINRWRGNAYSLSKEQKRKAKVDFCKLLLRLANTLPEQDLLGDYHSMRADVYQRLKIFGNQHKFPRIFSKIMGRKASCAQEKAYKNLC